MDVLNYFRNVKGFEFGISPNAKVTPKYFTRQYALDGLNDRVIVRKLLTCCKPNQRFTKPSKS